MLQEIVAFYKDHYWKNEPIEDICYHVCPSILLSQYSINRDENGEMYGFTNWALLSDEAEKKFLSQQPLSFNDWKSGDNIWHIETVCIMNLGEIISWTKNNLAKNYGLNRLINWARVDNNKIRSLQKVYTKDSWLWADL